MLQAPPAEQIAKDLKGRYKTGFPVLKELIQNTEDASASEFHFGYSPDGVPSAEHQLLKGPGLFFVNNGDFRDDDAGGIQFYGQSSKAAGGASIGKFGLGMKSVFHFCEVFFFLAHDRASGYCGDKLYEKVINPWIDQTVSDLLRRLGKEDESTYKMVEDLLEQNPALHPLHREWDKFTHKDAQALKDHLFKITEEIDKWSERGSILWLPLRRETHFDCRPGEQARWIRQEFPGDDKSLLDFLFEDENSLSEDIAALIPMLRNVRRVAFWEIKGESATQKFNINIKLDEGEKRPSLVNVGADSDSKLNGTILLGGLKRIDANQELKFSGREYFAQNSDLDDMHSDRHWPQISVRGGQGYEKEKVRPHGAVFFSRTPGKGKLITNWSVFLPLDEDNTREEDCDGEHDFRLTLHGDFFTDIGRKVVHGLDKIASCINDKCDSCVNAGFKDQDTLRRAWNCELLRTAVLPLVLPALDTFCNDPKMDDKTRTALSKALEQSTLLKDFQKQITAEWSWLREIEQDGMRWKLREVAPKDNTKKKKVLELPAPGEEDSPDSPWQVFPYLKAVNDDYYLSDKDAPNIVHPDLVMQWEKGNLLKMLKSVEPEKLFSKCALLKYFTSFLEHVADELTQDEVNKQLGDLFKKGMRKNGEDELVKNKQFVKKIVNHIDKKLCFPIGNDVRPALREQLFSIDTDIVLVPKCFLASKTNQAKLEVNDALKLLEEVQAFNSPNQDFQKATLNLAEQIINGVPQKCREGLDGLRVLGAFDCQAETTVTVSPSEIKCAKENGVLFDSSAEGLAPILQKVILNERILLINAETAKLVLEERLPPCNEKEVLDFLGKQRRALKKEPDARAQLAEKLVDKVRKTDENTKIQGFRFLLHADEDHFDFDKNNKNKFPILWIPTQESVWKKLWVQVKEDGVLLLEKAIACKLPPDVYDNLRIKEINFASVSKELENLVSSYKLNKLKPSEFDKGQCDQILSEVEFEGRRWASLPFHWNSEGSPVQGNGENVFLVETTYKVESDELHKKLHEKIVLIPLSENKKLSRRQKNYLTELDGRKIIEIALGMTSLQNVWCDLLNVLTPLELNPKSDERLVSEIKEAAWVPQKNGKLRKPGDIIDLEVADEILAKAPDTCTLTTPSKLKQEFREHRYYQKFGEGYFVRGQEGLEKLGQVLKRLDTYQIGNVESKEHLLLNYKKTLELLKDSPHPGWRLLGAEPCGVQILKSSMVSQMSLDAIVDLLNWLVDKRDNKKQDGHRRQVFNHYLEVFAKTEGAEDAVCRLTLLNRDDDWEPSEKLVSNVAGAEQAHVLNDEQAKVLEKVIKTKATADVLHEYFQSWSGQVALSLIRLFVLLFGKDESIKTLYEDLPGQHSRECLIKKVPWIKPQRTNSERRKPLLSGLSLEGAFEKLRITVGVYNGEEKLTVCSILGECIEVPPAPLGKEDNKISDTLMVEKPHHYKRHSDEYQVDLRLKKIAVDEDDKKQLLKASIKYLLEEVYEQPEQKEQFEKLWNTLDSDQDEPANDLQHDTKNAEESQSENDKPISASRSFKEVDPPVPAKTGSADPRAKAIGLAGEEWLMEGLKRTLCESGNPELADKIEHVSKVEDAEDYKGERSGYDIKSYDKENGKEILIEVKTTRSEHKNTPFFITPHEWEVAMKNKENYWIYRVYDFKGKEKGAPWFRLSVEDLKKMKMKMEF